MCRKLELSFVHWGVLWRKQTRSVLNRWQWSRFI